MAKISKNTISKLADWLDDLIKLNGLVEQFDGFAIKTALGFINNKFGDNIPDELTPAIEGIVNDIVDGNYEAAEEKLAKAVAELINTPLIDGTDDEIEAYETIITAIDTVVRGWIEKAKE